MTPPASNDPPAPDSPVPATGESPPSVGADYRRTRAAEDRLWERVGKRLENVAKNIIAGENWTCFSRPDPAEAVQEAVVWCFTQSGGGHYPKKDEAMALEAWTEIAMWLESSAATEEELVERIARALHGLLRSVVRRPPGRKGNQESVAIINEHDHDALQSVNPSHLVKTVVENKVGASGDDPDFYLSKLLPEEKAELFQMLESQCTAKQKLVLAAWKAGELDDKTGAHSAVAAKCGITSSQLSIAKEVIHKKGCSALAAFSAISKPTNVP